MESNVENVQTVQTGLGVDHSLLQAFGFIRNLEVKPRPGKDTMWKFQLRYIDETGEHTPESWYSGFKEPPAKEGDYIIFKYKVNGIYNNVKDIIDVKLTHQDADDEDQEKLEEVMEEIVEEKPKVDLEEETIVNKPVRTKLEQPYLALILNATIHLCTKRGTLTDEEIKQQYNRFLQLL